MELPTHYHPKEAGEQIKSYIRITSLMLKDNEYSGDHSIPYQDVCFPAITTERFFRNRTRYQPDLIDNVAAQLKQSVVGAGRARWGDWPLDEPRWPHPIPGLEPEPARRCDQTCLLWNKAETGNLSLEVEIWAFWKRFLRCCKSALGSK